MLLFGRYFRQLMGYQVKRGTGFLTYKLRDFHRHFTLVHVAKRENVIVNRLNKTKIERVVDHEQEKVDRIKQESAIRRVAAAEKVRVSCLWGNNITYTHRLTEESRCRTGAHKGGRESRSILRHIVQCWRGGRCPSKDRQRAGRRLHVIFFCKVWI